VAVVFVVFVVAVLAAWGYYVYNASETIATRSVTLLVRQRGRFDCGVAVVATVAQVSYEAVLDRPVFGLTSKTALDQLVLWRVLRDVTGTEWCIHELCQPWPRISACRFPDPQTVILLQRADRSRHYVAVCGGLVYDPSLEMPVALGEYPDRKAQVVTLFWTSEAADRPREEDLNKSATADLGGLDASLC
jgi:hypothetical protein